MPLPEAGTFALLLLFGCWAGLDGTSLGQFMVSRPLVAATVAGALAGSPGSGAAVGLLLEAMQLHVLPVGAARFPEAGPAAVVAGGAFALTGGGATLLLSAVVFALAWEWVGGATVHWLRTVNVRIAAAGAAEPVDPAWIARRLWSAVALDAVRSFFLVLAGLPLAILVLQTVHATTALPDSWSRPALWTALAVLIAAAAKRLVGRMPWLLAGLLAGLATAWLR